MALAVPHGETSRLNTNFMHKEPSIDVVDGPSRQYLEANASTPLRTHSSSMSTPPSHSEHDVPNGYVSTSTSGRMPECMNIEAERLKTFSNWPVSFMDPHKLAAAGFFYFNKQDIVRCAFCGIDVGRWVEGDDPFRDHQRWSPSCGFVRRLPVGNVPLSSSSASYAFLGQPPMPEALIGYDTCGPYGIELRPFAGPERGLNRSDAHAASLEKLGIHKSRGPTYPNYSTYESRLRSYESWPVSLKQKPDKLSEAGFYYTGKGDQTVCFHCGGGLKDWEESDDPWEEHAQWFSQCIYLILVKGVEFVNEVTKKKKAILSAEEAIDLKNTAERQHSTEAGSKTVERKTETEASSSGQVAKSSEGASKVVDDARLCKICYSEELGVVFLPCGHIVACVKCAPSLEMCAVCRKPFTATVRAFLS